MKFISEQEMPCSITRVNHYVKENESMNKKEDRFVIVKTEGNGLTSANRQVIVDRETGVNYLFFHDGYAGGLTVLVDPEGKPLVTR